MSDYGVYSEKQRIKGEQVMSQETWQKKYGGRDGIIGGKAVGIITNKGKKFNDILAEKFGSVKGASKIFEVLVNEKLDIIEKTGIISYKINDLPKNFKTNFVISRTVAYRIDKVICAKHGRGFFLEGIIYDVINDKKILDRFYGKL
ncbi:MAG: hypothetical protein BWK75_05655 [Candidatus Altiarchaeales archaeon A3]|nr:MAG: hypothetical protein BWK75_05655 [Candidatus Altiarchaeales archaeon A3]